MKIYFVQKEIEAATNYVLQNNPYAKSSNWTYSNVYDTILQLYYSCNKQVAENPDEAPYASTMGVSIIGEFCGEDTLVLRATVHPYFGEYELSRMA